MPSFEEDERNFVRHRFMSRLHVAMTMADTEYEIPLPECRRFLARPYTAGTAWNFSADSGEVTGTESFPLLANETLHCEGPFAGQKLYASTSVAGSTLVVLYV